MGHKASPFHSSGGKVGGIALRLSSFHNRPLAPAGGRFVLLATIINNQSQASLFCAGVETADTKRKRLCGASSAKDLQGCPAFMRLRGAG